MTPTPYLFFNGNCADAMTAYADIFGSAVEEVMHGSDMPGDFPVPEERKGWIMHSTLRIGDGQIMASDNIMGHSDPMAGSSVLVSFPTLARAQEVFARLSDGGEVMMAFEPTFWSAGFGTCTDRFGVKWMVGCDEPPAGH